MLATTTLKATSGNVTVRVWLYGEVSIARYEAELRIAQHRADQLAATWPAAKG